MPLVLHRYQTKLILGRGYRNVDNSQHDSLKEYTEIKAPVQLLTDIIQQSRELSKSNSTSIKTEISKPISKALSKKSKAILSRLANNSIVGSGIKLI